MQIILLSTQMKNLHDRSARETAQRQLQIPLQSYRYSKETEILLQIQLQIHLTAQLEIQMHQQSYTCIYRATALTADTFTELQLSCRYIYYIYCKTVADTTSRLYASCKSYPLPLSLHALFQLNQKSVSSVSTLMHLPSTAEGVTWAWLHSLLAHACPLSFSLQQLLLPFLSLSLSVAVSANSFQLCNCRSHLPSASVFLSYIRISYA